MTSDAEKTSGAAKAALPERPAGAVEPGEELDPLHPPGCFGCGAVAGGLGLRFRAGEGLVVVGSFTVRDVHEGAPGLLHGGLLATAFDDSLGTPAMLAGMPAVTAHLEVDYRSPVPIGATVWIVSRVEGVSGRKVHVSGEARLNDPAGPLAAQARGLYLRIDAGYFLAHSRPEDLAAAGIDPSAAMPEGAGRRPGRA
ncbi:PaaI family thioesterase [Nonomuraea sp. H19]|uniref:PaaI family thioesterase n=1 Tax=Nonomuraea sp. H19 TaxID=3452206 RepID=UPI003F89B2AB